MKWRARVDAQVGDLHLDVDLHGDGTPVALVGENGSGKTTLLRILCGAQPSTRAEIVVGETVLASTKRGIDRPPEARGVGYVPQGHGLFPHLSVLDNVAFGLVPRERDRATRHDRARKMLEILDCAHLAGRRPRSLSGGESQRVALARALVTDPRIVLLDEPLAALDATARRSLRAVLTEQLKSLGRPAIVVTHDVRDVEALGATVFALDAGRVVQQGDLAALRAAPATDFIAEWVGPAGS